MESLHLARGRNGLFHVSGSLGRPGLVPERPGFLRSGLHGVERRRFDATTPIEIDVASLHALPQPGCARLEVTTRQRDVLEQGKRADQELRWQVSFCRDGSVPEKR